MLGLFALVIFLTQVFSGRIILSQSFIVGSFKIHYYGVIMALAVGSGFYLAKKRAAKYEVNEKAAEDIMFWLVIGGFIGARLYHVASSFGYYYLHPADIFKFWNGGLSIYGAILGGFLTLFIVKRVFNFQFSIFKLLDWLTPSLILGQIIGRFGNLFNYELFGYPTNLIWKMFVPTQFRAPSYGSFNFFHPLFLYEAIGNAIIFVLILKFFQPTRSGNLFFCYVLLYNVLRFCLEFLRIDSVFIGHIRQNAIVSLVLIFLSLAYLIFQKTHEKLP